MAAVAKVLALFLFLILPALVAFLAADHSRDQPLLALPAAAPLEHTIDSSRVVPPAAASHDHPLVAVAGTASRDSSRVVPPAAASHAHPLVAVAGTASRDSSRVVPPAAASHDHPPVAVTGTTSHDSSRIVPPAAASHDHPLVVRAASPHGHPPRRLADREPSSEHDGGIRFAGFTYWIAGFAVAAAGVATKLIDGFAVAAVGMAAKWMGGFAIAIGVSVGVVLINHFFSYPHFARHRRGGVKSRTTCSYCDQLPLFLLSNFSGCLCPGCFEDYFVRLYYQHGNILPQKCQPFTIDILNDPYTMLGLPNYPMLKHINRFPEWFPSFWMIFSTENLHGRCWSCTGATIPT